jgi:hypothetical protein
VTLVELVEMLPVSVPLNVPPPEALLNVTVVVLVGLDGLPSASSDVTVTLNAVPAVPVAGTVVNANCVAAAGLTVRLELATPASPDPEMLGVIVVVWASTRVMDAVPWPDVKVTVAEEVGV